MSDDPPPGHHLGRRFVARNVDALVLLVPVLVVTATISDGFHIGGDNVGRERVTATAVGLLITLAYFVACEAGVGRTPGKVALGLRVWSPAGRPTVVQAVKRNAWILLSAIPGSMGGFVSLVVAIAIAVTISRSPLGQGLHDRWAGVRVVHEA